MTEKGPQGSVRKDTVLVVDDEPDVRDSLKRLLEKTLTDVDVVTAADGRQGLERLAEGGVDLIISDYKMPGLTGTEFLTEAKALYPDVPRIMMTAFGDMNIAIGAINEARIESFFTKPLDPEKVVEAVWDTLDRHWSQLERQESATKSLDSLRNRDPVHEEDG